MTIKSGIETRLRFWSKILVRWLLGATPVIMFLKEKTKRKKTTVMMLLISLMFMIVIPVIDIILFIL